MEHTATAFTARPSTKRHSGDRYGRRGEVVVYTDEGDEPEIVVPRHRLRALIAACLDALEGDIGTY